MREWESGAVENIHGALPYIRFAPILALVGVGVNRIGKVSPDIFFEQQKCSSSWIFYVNNNPIVAPAGHPVVRFALERATRILLNCHERPGIQSTTGPGNLTASLVKHAIASTCQGLDRDFVILGDWQEIAVTRWPLSYRNDKRNWRLAVRW